MQNNDLLVKNMKVSITLFVIVVIVTILLTPLSGTVTVPNSGKYLIQALSIIGGHEVPIYLNRPPGFAYCIAAAFAVFGVAIEYAYLIVRIGYALTSIGTFLLAHVLFGPWVALVSALLVLSSYGVLHTSTQLNLDTIVPACILFSLWAQVMFVKRKTLIWSIVAGVCIGLAYLVKEIALLYVCIPFGVVLIWRELRNKKGVLHCVVFFSAFILTVSPWIVYIMRHKLGVMSFLGGLSPQAIGRYYEHSNPLVFLINLNPIKGIVDYYRIYLHKPFFIIAPLWLASWMCVIMHACRNYKNAIALFFFGVCYFPLLVYLGIKGDRLGHGVLFFSLSYIALGYMIVYFLQLRSRRIEKILIGLFVVIVLVATNSRGFVFMTGGTYNGFRHTFLQKNELVVEGKHAGGVRQAAEWMNVHIPDGTKLYVDNVLLDPLRYFTKLAYPMSSVRIKWSVFNVSMNQFTHDSEPLERAGVVWWPLAKFSQEGYGDTHGRYRNIGCATKEDILKTLEKIQNGFVVVSDSPNLIIGLYLSQLKRTIVFDNDAVKIYFIPQQNIVWQPEWDLIASNKLEEELEWLKLNFPAEYKISEEYFISHGLSVDVLSKHSYEYLLQDAVDKYVPSEAVIGVVAERDHINVGEGYTVKNFTHDSAFDGLSNYYDYLIVQDNPSLKELFPLIWRDVHKQHPVYYCPTVAVLGDGWYVYKLEDN